MVRHCAPHWFACLSGADVFRHTELLDSLKLTFGDFLYRQARANNQFHISKFSVLTKGFQRQGLRIGTQITDIHLIPAWLLAAAALVEPG